MPRRRPGEDGVHPTAAGRDAGFARQESERLRMVTQTRSIAAVLLWSVAGAPARANDAADLQAKVAAALMAAKSFVMTMTMVPNAMAPKGLTSKVTFVAPDRYHTLDAIAGETHEEITIGRTIYVSTNGARYRKDSVPPDIVAENLKIYLYVNVASVLPDRTQDGKTFGAYTSMIPVGGEPKAFTCTYDRQTYLPATCSNELVTMVYSGYDDPKIVVEPPTETK
jgi:hypothetical protein